MVAGSNGYARWFPFPYEIVNDINKAEIIWWEGGADIATWLYGEKEGRHTYSIESSSKQELAAWKFSKDKNIFKIGTCKGCQNLSVYHGAKMVQHMQHPGYHLIETKDGFQLSAISLHHQQVILDEKYTGLKAGKDYDLVGWTRKLSRFHLNGEDRDYGFSDDYKEPEIITFKNTWGVQSHPEMMASNSSFVAYCQKSLADKMKQDGFIS